MILSIILVLVFFVLMKLEKDVGTKIEYATITVAAVVSTWGNYILNAIGG